MLSTPTELIQPLWGCPTGREVVKFHDEMQQNNLKVKMLHKKAEIKFIIYLANKGTDFRYPME